MTLGFLLTITAIVIAYDVWVARTVGVDATISRVCKRGFTAFPSLFALFLFWLGIFIGHVWLHTD